jgi:hypothetical protein
MGRWSPITPESMRAEIDRIRYSGKHSGPPMNPLHCVSDTPCRTCGNPLRYKASGNLICGGQWKCKAKAL